MKSLIKLLPIFAVCFMLAQNSPPPSPSEPFPGDEMPPPPPPPSKPDKMQRLMQLAQMLDLTEEQKSQIKAIDDSFEQEEENINAQMKALHEHRKELMQAKKAEISKILTPQQKEKLKEMRANRRKNAPNMQPNRRNN